jgi:hypothetical protein
MVASPRLAASAQDFSATATASSNRPASAYAAARVLKVLLLLY